MAGLTSTGITIKDLDELLADLEADEIATIDADINTEADSVLGQLNGIYAAALAELWELVEEVYQSAYADTASGQSLAYIAALTGVYRREATKAEISVNFTTSAATTVPAGTQAYPDGDPDSLFETYTDLVFGGADLQNIAMYAVNPGSATTAVDDQVLILATPVPNVLTVNTTVTDAVIAPGADEETDSELRYRREQSLAQAGASTVEAIRANMLEVTGVNSCTVFENPTGVTDSNGVPPYSIEVLVYSSAAPSYTAQDVADAIWASKPAGTGTYGSEGPETVTDSSGNNHDIYYSEPTTVRTYVSLELYETTDGTYIEDANVKQAIADWAIRTLQVGQDVYASDIINVVSDLDGVRNVKVDSVRVDDSASLVTVDLTVGSRELATIAVADVTVTST